MPGIEINYLEFGGPAKQINPLKRLRKETVKFDRKDRTWPGSSHLRSRFEMV